MDEKRHRLQPPPVPPIHTTITATSDPLLLRIRASIASLRSTSYAKYNLLPTHNFRHRPTSARHAIWLPHVRRKWMPFILGGICFTLTFLVFHFLKHQSKSVDELGPTSTLKQPYFSQETDAYPKKLAILIVPSSNSSIETDSKAIADTWGNRNNISDQVDLWFATAENTLVKFGWPSIWGDNQTSNWEQNILRKIDQDVVQNQENFNVVIEAFSFMYENYLDHYQHFMRISDRTFVRVQSLLSSLHSSNDSVPELIGQPVHDSGFETTYCARGPGYIISRSLLNHIGPHLTSCLEQTMLPEDEAMAQCFKVHVPNFRGCEKLLNGSGEEFLAIKNDRPQEEQFNNAESASSFFSGALSAGELDGVEQVKMLWDKYGDGDHPRIQES